MNKRWATRVIADPYQSKLPTEVTIDHPAPKSALWVLYGAHLIRMTSVTGLVLGVICFLASLKFGRYGDFAMIVAMGHFILGVVGGSVIAFLVGYVWIARKVFWRCHSDGTMGGNGAGEYAVTAMADPTRPPAEH